MCHFVTQLKQMSARLVRTEFKPEEDDSFGNAVFKKQQVAFVAEVKAQ